jgi:hypothetical protein
VEIDLFEELPFSGSLAPFADPSESPSCSCRSLDVVFSSRYAVWLGVCFLKQ